MQRPPKHHSVIYSDPDYSHVNENNEEKTLTTIMRIAGKNQITL